MHKIDIKNVKSPDDLSLNLLLVQWKALSSLVCHWPLRSERHISTSESFSINILKPTGYVMHHQFTIQQLYAVPTLYLCGMYLSVNKQRLLPLAP